MLFFNLSHTSVHTYLKRLKSIALIRFAIKIELKLIKKIKIKHFIKLTRPFIFRIQKN